MGRGFEDCELGGDRWIDGVYIYYCRLSAREFHETGRGDSRENRGELLSVNAAIPQLNVNPFFSFIIHTPCSIVFKTSTSAPQTPIISPGAISRRSTRRASCAPTTLSLRSSASTDSSACPLPPCLLHSCPILPWHD